MNAVVALILEKARNLSQLKDHVYTDCNRKPTDKSNNGEYIIELASI